jgi:transcriptional regulator with XRE-family HTH domain
MEKAQSLGQLVRRLRMSAGLSQRKLAEQLQIDPTYLSHVEADRREPSLQLLRRIATELNSPPGLLLALALWTELPGGEQESYRPLIERMVEIAALNQQLRISVGE